MFSKNVLLQNKVQHSAKVKGIMLTRWLSSYFWTIQTRWGRRVFCLSSDDLHKRIDLDWCHNPSHDGRTGNSMHWDISVKIKEQNSLFLIHFSEFLIFCRFASLCRSLFDQNILLKCSALEKYRWWPWTNGQCVCLWLSTLNVALEDIFSSPPSLLSKKTFLRFEWLTYLLLLRRSAPPSTISLSSC